MADLKTNFEQAQKDVNTLSKKPDNDTLLKLYALYKQATEGDISGKRPGMLDIKGRAKYDAWEKEKGNSKDKAMQDYIDLVNKLLKG